MNSIFTYLGLQSVSFAATDVYTLSVFVSIALSFREQVFEILSIVFVCKYRNYKKRPGGDREATVMESADDFRDAASVPADDNARHYYNVFPNNRDYYNINAANQGTYGQLHVSADANDNHTYTKINRTTAH